ncbi:MAG: Hsp20/alpha crystallin family protein [Burkholderia sp.]|nr:Hsp20/alpha crystallin family protein [Burkholderia sp.]
MAPVLRNLEQAPRMMVDIEENDQAYILRADVPGANREDIAVTVDGNTVTIAADVVQEQTDQRGDMLLSERVYGEEYRVFTLPQEVDESKAEARVENGILVLTLPKKTGGGAKKLNIQASAGSGAAKGQAASAQSASSGGQGQAASPQSAGSGGQGQAASPQSASSGGQEQSTSAGPGQAKSSGGTNQAESS